MLSNRNIVLSMAEVEEAIKTYIRKKYHEKLDDLTHLTYISGEDDSGVIFNFCKECKHD